MMHHATMRELTLVKAKLIVIVSEFKVRKESLPLTLHDPVTLVDPGSRFTLRMSFNTHTHTYENTINSLLIQ